MRDALAVIADSGARSPWCRWRLAHAGWVGIELRRRLGHAHTRPRGRGLDRERGAGGVSARRSRTCAWTPTGTTQSPPCCSSGRPASPTRTSPAFLADMGAASGEMWDRAAREIEGSYARHGSPLRALSLLEHAGRRSCIWCRRRATRARFERDRAYTAEHHWYHAAELPARSHFPLFEAPRQAADEIERFAARVGGRRARAGRPDEGVTRAQHSVTQAQGAGNTLSEERNATSRRSDERHSGVHGMRHAAGAGLDPVPRPDQALCAHAVPVSWWRPATWKSSRTRPGRAG